MYLKYNQKTGEILKISNLPMTAPYIEITQEQANTISKGKYYIVNEKVTPIIPETYKLSERLKEIEEELIKIDKEYTTALDTPVYYNGKQYKPKWIDDGTYIKLITGIQARVVTFPQTIWDATELEENAVSMTLEQFMGLCTFLTLKQQELFNTRKQRKAELLKEKQEIEIILN